MSTRSDSLAPRTRLTNRRRFLGGIGASAALLLAACAAPEAAPTQAPSQSTQPTQAAKPAATTAPSSGATPAAATPKPAAGGGAYDPMKWSGTQLQWMVLSAPWVDMLKENLPEFEGQTGIKVNIDSQTWQEKVLAIMTAGSDEVDFYMSNKGTYGLRYAENGWYEDIEPYVNDSSLTAPDYNFDDFAVSAIDTCKVNDKLVGIPTWADHNFFYYRKDLFQNAGIAPLPTDKALSIEEFEDIATKLTNRDAQQYGVVTRGGARALIPMWISWLVVNGGNWKDSSGKWALNTPAAVKSYMQYGKLLREWGPPGITEQTDLNEIYCQGRAATYINTVVLVPQVLGPDSCGQAANTGIAPMPGGRPYFFSWYMAISPYSKNKEAAWQFIQWASNQKNNVRSALQGLPPVRNSVWTDPEFTSSEAATQNKELYEAQKVSIDGGVADWLPPVHQVLDARDAIGAVVLKAAEGASEAEVQQAADELVKQMEEIETRR